MNRMVELLRLAAQSLNEGDMPLSGDWLRTHDVTADECMSLATLMATGCQVVANGLNNPKSTSGLATFATMAGESL